ncbi:MAG: hypothetical protein AAF804_00625, partial [Bacteroidota bacterium]
MKKFHIILLVLSTALMILWGCKKEYVPPTGEFSDGIASKTGESIISLGDTVGFVDLSQGVANRVWVLPEGARFVEFEEGTDPASSRIVNIEFNAPGIWEVLLDVDLETDTAGYDTTFVIEVLDTVTTKIEIVEINSAFIEEGPTQISIYEGGSIVFADSSTGDVNRRLWLFPGGDPEKAGGISQVEDAKVQDIEVGYSIIGVYDVTLISWRLDPFARPDTVVLKDFVNVVKNEEPPSIVSIQEDAVDSSLHLTYNLAMKITGDLTSNFSLTVDGNPVAINSVRLNATDNRIIDIQPAINIFHTSNTQLSYDGNGGLTRINDVAAPAFSGEVVTLTPPPNVLAAAGIAYEFENGNTIGWDFLNWVPTNADPITNNSGVSIEHTTESHTGNGGMVIHLNANEDLGVDEKNNFILSTDFANFPVTLEAGKQYRLEFWYKVEGDGLN